MPPAPARREEPGGGQPGHGDLVALAPVEVDHLLADDAAEERDVGGEHPDAEDHPDCDPHGVPVTEPAEGILEIEETRDEHVDRDQQQDHRDRRLDQPLGIGEEARLSLRDDFAGSLFVVLSAWWALLPHAPDVRKDRYSVAMRSRRCNAPLTASASGAAWRSPRRMAKTRAAPASRSTT